MLAKFRKYWFIKVGERSEPRKFWKKNVFLTTKYVQIVKLEHLLCPKVGGGVQTHLCPPTFESGEARAPCPPLLLRPWWVKWQMIECWDGKRNNENRVEG